MSPSTTDSSSQIALIYSHALLLLKGVDAVKYLQGQVTCDVEALTALDQSTLGAHCTPKGRMLFSFRACMLADDTIALCVPSALLEDAQAALKKYSVFSKVEISDGRNEYQILGISRDQAQKVLSGDLPQNNNEALVSEGGAVIALDGHRFELWLPKTKAETLLSKHPSTTDLSQWRYQQILAGIGEVMPETVEQFIPQLLNYQAVGNGISFNKGCYTGQEVVARMQFRGKSKRRLYRLSLGSEIEIAPGTPLFTDGTKQAIGHVVMAQGLEGHTHLLAVVTDAAVEADQVFLDTQLEEKLRPEPLPYAIPVEVG